MTTRIWHTRPSASADNRTPQTAATRRWNSINYSYRAREEPADLGEPSISSHRVYFVTSALLGLVIDNSGERIEIIIADKTYLIYS